MCVLNFGAFTANRTANAMQEAGCESVLIGHCEERNDKMGILAEAGVTDRAAVLMVGDREHDVLGAARCGLSCLGVLYGYGSRDELEQAGACAVVPTVEAIGDYILTEEGK